MAKSKSFKDKIDRLGCKRCDTRRAELKDLLGAGVDSYKSLVAVIGDSSKDLAVRRTAAWLTGEFPAKKSGALALVAALKDSDTGLCVKAAEALGNLGHKAAIPALSELLKSDDERRSYAAINALGKIQGKQSAELLIECIQSGELHLAWEAAKALIIFDSSKVTDRLIQILFDSPNVESRAAAAYALGFRGDKKAASYLMRVVRSETETDYVRSEALEAIGVLSVRNHDTIKGLTELLSHNSISIRFWAAYALASIAKKKDEEVIAELNRVSAEDKALLAGWWTVASEASYALSCILKQGYLEPEVEDKTLSDDDTTVQLTKEVTLERTTAGDILSFANGDRLTVYTSGKFKFSTNRSYTVHENQPQSSTVLEMENGDGIAFSANGIIQILIENNNIRIHKK